MAEARLSLPPELLRTPIHESTRDVPGVDLDV